MGLRFLSRLPFVPEEVRTKKILLDLVQKVDLGPKDLERAARSLLLRALKLRKANRYCSRSDAEGAGLAAVLQLGQSVRISGRQMDSVKIMQEDSESQKSILAMLKILGWRSWSSELDTQGVLNQLESICYVENKSMPGLLEYCLPEKFIPQTDSSLAQARAKAMLVDLSSILMPRLGSKTLKWMSTGTTAPALLVHAAEMHFELGDVLSAAEDLLAASCLFPSARTFTSSSDWRFKALGESLTELLSSYGVNRPKRGYHPTYLPSVPIDFAIPDFGGPA